MRFQPWKGKLTGALCFGALLFSVASGTVFAQQAASGPSVAAENQKITLALRDAPLRTVLDQIFSSSGLQYTVDSNVPDVLVTLNLRDTSIQQALRTVVSIARSQIPGLALRKEGDLFMIQIKAATPPPAPAEEAPPEDTDAETTTTWEKIPIQFNSVLAVLQGLATGGFGVIPTEYQIQSSTNGMGGGMGGGTGSGMGGGFGGNGSGSSGFGSSGFGSSGLGSSGFGSSGFGSSGFGSSGLGSSGYGGTSGSRY